MNEILQKRKWQMLDLANKLLVAKDIDIKKDYVSKSYEAYDIYFYLAESEYAIKSKVTHSIFKKITLNAGELSYTLYLHFNFFDGYDKEINADKLYEFTSTIEEWLKKDIDNKE